MNHKNREEFIRSVNGSSLVKGGTAPGRGGDKASQVTIKRNPYQVEGCRIKFGTANVGTMSKSSGEIVEMMYRRGLDFCCLQETRWKGESARKLGGDGKGYKFFWKGCKEGTAGVGVLVAERWIESVIEVRR